MTGTIRLLSILIVTIVSHCWAIADTTTTTTSTTTTSSTSSTTQSSMSRLELVSPLRNLTRFAGDPLKLRCEVRVHPSSAPSVRSIVWLKNEAPMSDEDEFDAHGNRRWRVRIKTKYDDSASQWSRIRFRALDVMDTGVYRCEASNGLQVLSAESMLKVHRQQRRKTWRNEENEENTESGEDGKDEDDDYVDQAGLIPQSFPLDFGADLSQGVDGLPGHLGKSLNRMPASSIALPPNLKPTLRSGSCQTYTGSICSRYLGVEELVFVSDGLKQEYIEQKLRDALAVITSSPELTGQCAQYAVPAICASTLPPCDAETRRPRSICRAECEILEHDVCRKELSLVRGQPLLHHQLVLPDCDELPVIGSSNSYNCVSLGMRQTDKLIAPHTCYNDHGEDYRGTVSITRSGLTCKPWHLSLEHHEIFDVNLVGGHNFCRNPRKADLQQPWCFTNDPLRPREECGLRVCTENALWVYVTLPIVFAILVFIAVLIATALTCLLRSRSRKSQSHGFVHDALSSTNTTASSNNFVNVNPNLTTLNNNYAEMEMSALLPPPPPPASLPPNATNNTLAANKPRDFPVASLRFHQEMGEGVFGKVYSGDLGGLIGGSSTLVAIKTLRSPSLHSEFVRELDEWSELRSHPNILSLLGTVLKDEPMCLVYEYLSLGTLQAFLTAHNPGLGENDLLGSSFSSSEHLEKNVESNDLAYMAIQIACGMDFLASRNLVHRDLATRNCLMSDHLVVKIAVDLGLSGSQQYASDYYRVPGRSKSLLPIRWMPIESIVFGQFNSASDVYSYGVLLWELYSYGLQPYVGIEDAEVIEMIRGRQLLTCPHNCPSRMFAFMVECWHEMPARRPTFAEIHARLAHWEGLKTGNASYASSNGTTNNTGSTNASNNENLKVANGSNHGYSTPFGHLPSQSLVQSSANGHHAAIIVNGSNVFANPTSNNNASVHVV